METQPKTWNIKFLGSTSKEFYMSELKQINPNEKSFLWAYHGKRGWAILHFIDL